MIYVDVTAACLLPLQSGIPRTTRGVYRLLNEHRSQHLTPIFWQPFRGGYTRLSTRARQLLDDPFSRHVPGHTPRDSTLPLLRAGLSDLMREWPQAVALPEILRKDDVLLLTSIFPDNRLEYLQRLMVVPGRKIAFFHDAIPLHDPNVSRWEKTRHLKTLRLLAQVDQVIAVSEAARKDLHALWKEHGIPVEASTCALTWPVPFTSPRPAFSAPPWKTKTILYVSRLKLVKNHAALLATCEELWRGGLSFNLELIGCEDEAKESRQLIRQIRRLLEKGRSISWRAHVNEEDLHAAYQRATFTIFPSLMEGFGLPIIESLWHGRGVICSDEDAVGELSRAGGCVRVDVQDYAALTTATRELLQNEQKCLDLAKEAYARPVRSWPDYWRELEPLLEPR